MAAFSVLLLLWCVAFNLLEFNFNNAMATYDRNACVKRDTQNIPKDHLFYSKKQPLVIGHQGQSKKSQENTIEGIKSLIGTGADGFQADVVLTDYGQLVLFHPENAMHLTGKDKLIYKMTPEEIKSLKYKKRLQYGKMVYNYTKERNVGLLEDLFTAVKDIDMIIYLEMRSMFWNNKTRSVETGKAVAKLIRKFGLEKKVLLTSLDPFKVFAAKIENPAIVTGSYLMERYWKQSSLWYTDVKDNLKTLPGLETCLLSLPNNSSLLDFLFQTGSMVKAENGSLAEFEFGLFSNTQLIKDPLKTLRENYNKDITFGVSTVYSMALSENEIAATESKVQYLIDKGVARLITDDVSRLMKKLGRKKPANSSNRNNIISCMNVFVVWLLFICNVIL